MSEAIAVNNETIRERFEVDNDMKAEWCLSKIRKIRADQKREIEELERQMSFYKAQIDSIKTNADDDVRFFEGMLREYFESRVDAGFAKATKTKVGYKLPTGELVLKHREPEYEYKKNQEKTIAYLKDSGLEEFVKVKEELDWSGLKQHCQVSGNSVVLKETGEVIPGIEATEREDEFKVDVKEV